MRLKVLEDMRKKAQEEPSMEEYLGDIKDKKDQRVESLRDDINHGDYSLRAIKDKVEIDERANSHLSDEKREEIAAKALAKKRREMGLGQ